MYVGSLLRFQFYRDWFEVDEWCYIAASTWYASLYIGDTGLFSSGSDMIYICDDDVL